MLFLRRSLPLIIAFAVGMIGILVYYIPHSGAQALEQELTTWYRIVAAFALLLGIYSLMRLHWNRVQRQQSGWGYSFLVFAGFVLMSIFATYNDGQGPLNPQVIDSGPFVWMFKYVQVPADATMFSILAFFIASAAYRTFRARTPEAAILLISAIIVMIGRVPIGASIYHAASRNCPMDDGCTQSRSQTRHLARREPWCCRHGIAHHFWHRTLLSRRR